MGSHLQSAKAKDDLLQLEIGCLSIYLRINDGAPQC